MEENTFWKNKKYLELSKKLSTDDAVLLSEVAGEAILYGIEQLTKKLKERKKS